MKKVMLILVVLMIGCDYVAAGDPNSNTITIDKDMYVCPKHDELSYHKNTYVCKIPKQWRDGDLPVIWQGWFGNTNISRLVFEQQQTIQNLRKELQRQQNVTYGMNVKDKQGKTVHRNGIFDRIVALEERVKKLQGPRLSKEAKAAIEAKTPKEAVVLDTEVQ